MIDLADFILWLGVTLGFGFMIVCILGVIGMVMPTKWLE